MFDSNILHWWLFWEQFCISVHDRVLLSDADKLVNHSRVPQQGAIEGLSRSSECYTEAIEARSNRPRLIHQTHVLMIMEQKRVAPPA